MHRRAYALPLVLALLLVLSATLSTALLGVQGSQLISDASIHRRQAFHNAEGVGVAVVELASQKLRSLPMEPAVPRFPVAAYATAMEAMLASQQIETNAFITDNAASYTTPKYTVERAAIGDLFPAQLRVLGSGPFQGMQAQVQQFSIEVGVLREHPRTPARAAVVASVERATMSMFQFYVFADGYLDLDPGGPVVTSGRIHANGDFCVAGEPVVGAVTSAKRILVSNNSNNHNECRRRAGEGRGANGIQVLIDDFGTFKELPTNFDHTAPTWAADALTKYNGHLRDSAHGVSELRMPLSGNPVVQAGANVLAMESVDAATDDSRLVPISQAKEDNTKSMRFLVDPMLQDEPADVRRQKFAFKADIRIIDGVWFLRDPLAPETPGKPIWSDHPGSGDVAYFDNEPVKVRDTIINDVTAIGQKDLDTLWGWPKMPEGYSYYGFKINGDNKYESTKTTTARSVISYGLLANIGGSVWNPGHYALPSGAPNLPTSSSPGSIKTADTIQALLDGARSGFKDGWLEVRSEQRGTNDADGRSDVETKRSRLLPINFDIAALSNALQNCDEGELGFHFSGTCNNTSSGRQFNGVVYIASTWPGAMNGLGSTPTTSNFALLAPFHDENPDAELPSSMCATTTRDFAAPLLGQARSCATTAREGGGGRARGSFPNVVRVFNGALVSPPTTRTDYAGVTIRANMYPQGLTIATNLPIIALGHINTETTPRDTPLTVNANDHFVPVLLAGDRFYRHSVNWRDERSNWKQPLNQNFREGKETTQHIEILAGWNPTPIQRPPNGHDHSSDGFEDFPRYNECWKEEARFRGAIVVAFASVFTRSGANNADGHGVGGGYLGCFPPRNEGFDYHLDDPTNQPPGAPLIVAQSIGLWQSR